MSQRLYFFIFAAFVSLGSTAVHAVDYSLKTLAEGIDYPWSIAFLPDNNYLVTSRSGQLLLISKSGEVQSIGNAPATYVASQGGFFDILLDRDFADNNIVYLSFAHGAPSKNATRVIRAKLINDALSNIEILFTAATKDTPVHYGGRLVQLNDGSLIVTVGDGFEYRESAQDTFSQFGKVIRFNTDGSVPSDNPYADGQQGDPYIFAYGLRNPQGLFYDSVNEVLYLNEHGPRGGDEVNIIQAGNNYGWPITSYGVNYSGAKVSPFQSLPGVTEPIHYWTPSIAVTGMTLYQGQQFPDWNGDIFVGALLDREVRRLDLEEGRVVAEEALFSEIGERIRDIRTGPDGFLYVLTDSDKGKIIRVEPAE